MSRDNCDDAVFCEDCGRRAQADQSTRGHHDEGFSECRCAPGPLVGGERVEFGTLALVAPVEKPFRVKYYDPKRGGVWVRKFEHVEEAAAFAADKRCYSKPAKVEVAA